MTVVATVVVLQLHAKYSLLRTLTTQLWRPSGFDMSRL